jgi:hypothetical protein
MTIVSCACRELRVESGNPCGKRAPTCPVASLTLAERPAWPDLRRPDQVRAALAAHERTELGERCETCRWMRPHPLTNATSSLPPVVVVRSRDFQMGVAQRVTEAAGLI